MRRPLQPAANLCATPRTACFTADAIRLSSQPVPLAAQSVTRSLECPLPSGDHHYCGRPSPPGLALASPLLSGTFCQHVHACKYMDVHGNLDTGPAQHRHRVMPAHNSPGNQCRQRRFTYSHTYCPSLLDARQTPATPSLLSMKRSPIFFSALTLTMAPYSTHLHPTPCHGPLSPTLVLLALYCTYSAVACRTHHLTTMTHGPVETLQRTGLL